MKKRGAPKVRIGPVTQKVLLLLLGGLALGLTGSPAGYFRIISRIQKDWKRINRRALYKAVRALYQAKLVDFKENRDDSVTIVLTDNGKTKALTYNVETMSVPNMKRWDKKWRMVIFDIPEKFKKARDALARSLKNMGFLQFQKSVFVHPFDCENEVDFVIEFFNLRPYVRFIIAENIDNKLHLKQHFNL